MKQMSFSDAEFEGKRKQTRREVFLAEMDRAMPWAALESGIEPHYPKAAGGRRPYPLSVMLRIHCLQQWYGLSDPAMEEELYEIASMRQFVGSKVHAFNYVGGVEEGVLDLEAPQGPGVPDETTILHFRHLLERHGLAKVIFQAINDHLRSKGLLLRHGTIVDATIIAAPSSTKNAQGKRDPEMHQTKKGNQYYFGMKAHVGVDADSGLVHTVIGTAANVNDVTQGHALLHGGESIAFGDAGYTGIEKRPEATRQVNWQVAMRPGKRRALKPTPSNAILERIEHMKAQVRARGEHAFRVIKRQFGFTKVRYRGLAKNTAQLYTLFALSNVWMARRQLIPKG